MTSHLLLPQLPQFLVLEVKLLAQPFPPSLEGGCKVLQVGEAGVIGEDVPRVPGRVCTSHHTQKKPQKLTQKLTILTVTIWEGF